MDFARGAWWMWLFVGLILSSTIALAEVRLQQERADVVVADTSDTEWAAAVETAVGAMLMQISGLEGMANSPLARVIAADAPRYVLDYSYATTDADTLRLSLRLDTPALRRALVERGMRIWPERRPTVLVWLVQRDGVERDFVMMDQAPEWLDDLRRQTAALGLRLVFPLLDLEDRHAVSFGDIAAGFHRPIREGSMRYAPDRILTGVIEAQAGEAEASVRWTLLDETMVIQRWQDDGSDTPSRLNRLVRDDFAYRPDLKALQRLAVTISNITSLDAYQQAITRLSNLSGVTQVKTTEVAGARAQFELALSVEPERVRESLARDPRLEAEGDGYRLR